MGCFVSKKQEMDRLISNMQVNHTITSVKLEKLSQEMYEIDKKIDNLQSEKKQIKNRYSVGYGYFSDC